MQCLTHLKHSVNYYLSWNNHGAIGNGKVKREIDWWRNIMNLVWEMYCLIHYLIDLIHYSTNSPKGEMVTFRQTELKC